MSAMFSLMGPLKVGQDETLECVEVRFYMRSCFDVDPSLLYDASLNTHQFTTRTLCMNT